MPVRLIVQTVVTPLSWLLLTTEVVKTVEMATNILRWYSYRKVEEYHKILKSGTRWSATDWRLMA